MSFRQYLQFHANNHESGNKRKEAQALLNVVGDDGNIDGNFLTGEKHGLFGLKTREKNSNGFNASTLNRIVNPWWNESYKKYSAQWDKDAGVGLHGPPLDPTRGQSGGSSMTYDPIAEAKKACLERFNQEDPKGYEAYMVEETKANKKD